MRVRYGTLDWRCTLWIARVGAEARHPHRLCWRRLQDLLDCRWHWGRLCCVSFLQTFTSFTVWQPGESRNHPCETMLHSLHQCFVFLITRWPHWITFTVSWFSCFQSSTLCIKIVYPLTFDNNFGKCGPTFNILSPSDSSQNSLCTHYKDFHHTYNMLLHYLVKVKNPKMLLIFIASVNQSLNGIL